MDIDTDVRAALGRSWTDDRPWAFLTDLTALGSRMGGSDGERRAASLVADAFGEAGVEAVTTRPFGMTRWRRGETALELRAPLERAFDAVALPYSPGGEATGELVDVGYGTPAEVEAADVEGRIAVASTTTPAGERFVHRMEKFGHAIEAGASAFVFVNHVPGQLPPTGALRFGDEAAAPAVGVSRETGAWLAEYAGDGGEVRLAVDAATEPGESQNVVGRLGPDTEEFVLLVAHYDAHDVAEGALDNGCGVATVAVAARVLAAMDLPVEVRVAGVGCEEVGLLGSERLAERLDLGRAKAVVNVDGAGRFRDLVAMSHASEATAAVARDVGEATRHPVRVREEPHPFSDQWPFVRSGVPALQLHSEGGASGTPVDAGGPTPRASDDRGRGWGHTRADTRDKVDDRNVREHGMLAALLVGELAGTEVPRLDAGELAAAFREADFETGMRTAGLWPAEWE